MAGRPFAMSFNWLRSWNREGKSIQDAIEDNE